MALYVVHHHLAAHIEWQATDPRFPQQVLNSFKYGHYAVVVFIVLSGYCLMLPVLRDGGTIRKGMANFFQRRARRILPPYFAALFLSGLLGLLAQAVTGKPVEGLSSVRDWVAHLFLVHNLSRDTAYTINGPLWSIATEWQIYFFFPLLLLPIWRRFGDVPAIFTGMAVGLGIWLAIPTFVLACPWFIAFFALGMVAAHVNFGANADRFKNVPLAKIGLALALCTYVTIRVFDDLSWHSAPKDQGPWFIITDHIFAIVTFCFLVHGTRATLENRPSRFVRFCTLRPLLWIGAFSYSLYLIHEPLLNVVSGVIHKMQLPGSIQYVLLCLSVFPLAIGSAYLFFLLFEKPFLRPLGSKKSS